jgi:hypothetical protein
MDHRPVEEERGGGEDQTPVPLVPAEVLARVVTVGAAADPGQFAVPAHPGEIGGVQALRPQHTGKHDVVHGRQWSRPVEVGVTRFRHICG